MTPDRVGLTLAALVAFIVLVLGVVRDVALLELGFRVVLAYGVTWAVVFVFISIAYRIADAEIAAQEKALEAQRAQEAEEESQEASTEGETE
jgi:uncharacterized membrane protein